MHVQTNVKLVELGLIRLTKYDLLNKIDPKCVKNLIKLYAETQMLALIQILRVQKAIFIR
jgi:hypothetical protein